jgi:uncharacterized protein
MIDQKLLDILCCPVSKSSLVLMSKAQLSALNDAIATDAILSIDGQAVRERIEAALITTDAKVIYKIQDGIPVLLPEEGIGTTQLKDFPR